MIKNVELEGAESLVYLRAPRVVLTPIRVPNTAMRTGGSALCTGVDGPRAGAGRSVTWSRARVLCLTSRRSAPIGRTVCACAGAARFADGA
jgi:hypothetical protein